MDYLFEMIVKETECEETILIDLINKLYDILSKISNYAIQLYTYPYILNINYFFYYFKFFYLF